MKLIFIFCSTKTFVRFYFTIKNKNISCWSLRDGGLGSWTQMIDWLQRWIEGRKWGRRRRFGIWNSWNARIVNWSSEGVFFPSKDGLASFIAVSTVWLALTQFHATVRFASHRQKNVCNNMETCINESHLCWHEASSLLEERLNISRRIEHLQLPNRFVKWLRF